MDTANPNSFRKHEELDIMNAPAPDSSNSLSSNLIGGGDSLSKKQLALKPKEEELCFLDSIFGAGTKDRIMDRDHTYMTSTKFWVFLTPSQRRRLLVRETSRNWKSQPA